MKIKGVGFGEKGRNNVKVLVGQRVCEKVTVLNDNEIMCNYMPMGAVEGPADVRVGVLGDELLPIGANKDAPPLQYTYYRPSILNVEPSVVPCYGNTSLVITGSLLGNKESFADIYLGDQRCLDSFLESSTKMTCITPPPKQCGEVDVALTVGGKLDPSDGSHLFDRSPVLLPNGDIMTFIYEPPVVLKLGPTHGMKGTILTIIGRNLGGDGRTTTQVFIGGLSCEGVQVISSTKLTCVVPDGAGTQQKILVTVEGLESDVMDRATFSYTSTTTQRFSFNMPRLEGFSPTSGPVYGGNMITISGSYLGRGRDNGEVNDALPFVFVNNVLCLETIFVDVNTIVCKAPSYENSLVEESVEVPITVMIGGVNLVHELSYKYEAVKIFAIEPSSGAIYGGERFIVKGRHFGGHQAPYRPLVVIGHTPCLNIEVRYMSQTCL
jgi:hypothetical protein